MALPTPGSRGADRVISFDAGPGAQPQYTDASALLGDPDALYAPAFRGILQLGRGGSVILAFTDNTIVDGPGPDFQVFGEAANDDSLLIQVGAGGQKWYAFARVSESPGMLDLAGLGISSVVYVRLTDAQPGTATGAEIDAVIALNSGPATQPLPVPPPTPSPTSTPAATPTPRVTPTPKPTPVPAAHWTLVADSFADFPGNASGPTWSYLWSHGTNNFRWEPMAWDGANWYYRDPNRWNLRITQDSIQTDARGDVAVLYKNAEGGTYRLEWDSSSLAFYKHLYASGSEGPGTQLPYSAIVTDINEWSLFFWVARGNTGYHILVFKLQQP